MEKKWEQGCLVEDVLDRLAGNKACPDGYYAHRDQQHDITLLKRGKLLQGSVTKSHGDQRPDKQRRPGGKVVVLFLPGADVIPA